MNFSNTHRPAEAVPKVLLVIVAHAILAYALITSIAHKTLKLPQVIEDVVLIAPDIPPPPPPPQSKPLPQAAPPEAFRPPVEVEVPPSVAPVETIQTAVLTELPAPATPLASTAAPVPAQTGMRTAVLAEGCATPAYPAQAARNGETGTVQLALLIGADGKVNDARVTKSSGSAVLDKAARNALSLCKFMPATLDGIATSGWSAISYVWKLD